MEQMDKFMAVAVQPEVKTHYITGKSPQEQLKENLEHCGSLIDRFYMSAWMRRSMKPRLFVFPESFLHGFGPARTRSYKTNSALAISIPGEETGALGRKCVEYEIYLAGSAFERDPEYPNHFFNTGFIISPKGEVILKYRKINTTNNNIELSTSPHDVLSQYGNDPVKIFPVVETPIGTLGMFICYDGMFPEVARCLALNGAEILIRPNQWFWGTTFDLEMMAMHNRIRAADNVAYLITTNWARSPQSEFESSCGHAMIVDYEGRVVIEKNDNDESFVQGIIDVKALREYRKTVKWGNLIAQLRTDLYAEAYKRKPLWPRDQFLEKNMDSLEEKYRLHDRVIENLVKQGIYK
jgi:predicted amidohydrolase